MKPAIGFLSLAAIVVVVCGHCTAGRRRAHQGARARIDEVVVTGFRGSLASALEEKRAQSGVVDVIKAEDVAKFPDANLAESLQRLPGVAVARDGGEGRSISVRGLGPGLHARTSERAGIADDVEWFRRHQSHARIRFQRVRVRTLQQPDRAQDAVSGNGGGVARRHGGSADRPAFRQPGHAVRDLDQSQPQRSQRGQRSAIRHAGVEDVPRRHASACCFRPRIRRATRSARRATTSTGIA